MTIKRYKCSYVSWEFEMLIHRKNKVIFDPCTHESQQSWSWFWSLPPSTNSSIRTVEWSWHLQIFANVLIGSSWECIHPLIWNHWCKPQHETQDDKDMVTKVSQIQSVPVYRCEAWLRISQSLIKGHGGHLEGGNSLSLVQLCLRPYC